MKKFFTYFLFIAALCLFIFLPGCTSSPQSYEQSIEKAEDAAIQQEFSVAASAQEAYKAQQGVYADSTEKLKTFAQIPPGLTVVGADENTYTLRLEKEGKTYYSQKK